MTVFDLLVYIGAAVTLLGFITLVWCILHVSKARRARLPDDEMRSVMQKVVPVNFAALAVSVLGLMFVVIGVAFS